MPRESHRRRVIVLLFLIAVLVGAAASDVVHDAVEKGVVVIGAVIERHAVAGIVLFIVLSALSAMVVFFSTGIILPAAIYAWGRPATLVFLWLGWLAGGAASYLVGRFPGRRLLRWLVPERSIDRYEHLVARERSFFWVLLFQLALPSEVPGYILGGARYSFLRYAAALGIAELLYAAGAVYVGDSFLRRDYLLLVVIGVAAVALSAIAMTLLLRRHARSEADVSGGSSWNHSSKSEEPKIQWHETA